MVPPFIIIFMAVRKSEKSSHLSRSIKDAVRHLNFKQMERRFIILVQDEKCKRVKMKEVIGRRMVEARYSEKSMAKGKK